MCTGRSQTPNSSRQEQEGSWQQLYPDMAQMFAGTHEQPQEQAAAAPSLIAQIINLLGIQPQLFQQHFNAQQHQEPPQHHNTEPSTPPPPPTPNAAPGFTPPSTSDTCNCNCQTHQQSHVSLFLTRLLNFSSRVTKHFLIFFSFVLLLLTLRLLPSCLMTSCLYLGLGAGLGLNLPTLLAGHILHFIVSLVDPFFGCLLLLWALHKMFIRRQPLINCQSWMGQWGNSRQNWANARQQWAYARQQWANGSQHCSNTRQQ